MREQTYLYSLILCAIFSQGIGILSDENIEESSDLHVRKKRLIDNTPNRNRPVQLHQVPYIIGIQKNNVSSCGGSILSPHVVLTAAHCFRTSNAVYKVLSGSNLRGHGTPHKIVHKMFHPHFNPKFISTDLVLLVIYPAIDLVHSPNQVIPLHEGPIVPNTHGIFSGWGSTGIENGKRTFAQELCSISVPIISEEECQLAYHEYAPITNENICTRDPHGKQGSGYGDSGCPLAVNGRLVGVMSWNKGMPRDLTPDVFINVAHPEHRNWILSFIATMEHEASKQSPLAVRSRIRTVTK